MTWQKSHGCTIKNLWNLGDTCPSFLYCRSSTKSCVGTCFRVHLVLLCLLIIYVCCHVVFKLFLYHKPHHFNIKIYIYILANGHVACRKYMVQTHQILQFFLYINWIYKLRWVYNKINKFNNKIRWKEYGVNSQLYCPI